MLVHFVFTENIRSLTELCLKVGGSGEDAARRMTAEWDCGRGGSTQLWQFKTVEQVVDYQPTEEEITDKVSFIWFGDFMCL